MREIKFRAWDKVNNCWYKPVYEAYKGNLFDLFIDPLGQICIHTMKGVEGTYLDENGDVKSFSDRFILCEFTGLHDKTGKEIYEGDVCKVDDGDNVYEVIFYMGGFMLAVLPRKIRIYHMADRLFSNIEVIGNIYENPD